MNQRIKQLWINALKSGEYIQGKHALRTESGYCCLGVLCDIAAKEGVGRWAMTERGWVFKAGTSARESLPYAVVEWADVDNANPNVKDGSLAYNNDFLKTFTEIADMIQAAL